MLEDRDIPFILAAAKEKSEQLGVSVWVPPLQTASCVLVSEEDGKASGAMIFAPVTEMILIGSQPRLVRHFMRKEAQIRAVLERSGVGEMVSFVPKALIREERMSGMEHTLARLRFRRIDQQFAAFEGRVYEQG